MSELLNREVKRLAREAGFSLARITTAEILEGPRRRYVEWVREGRHGQMTWIDEARAVKSSDPAVSLPGARSVICVGLSYWAGQRPSPGTTRGAIARYAWGRDYHEVMGTRLTELAHTLTESVGGEHKCYVDTGPIMDKALAERAGLGWYGRNSNVLTPEFGSFVLLGEIVTTLALEPDPPIDSGCGSCRLCVVACPTGAIGPDYSVDSRKCISYLTIEHRGPIPIELRSLLGAWVFGCDVCQDVCPPTMQANLEQHQVSQWSAGLRSGVRGLNFPSAVPVAPAPPVVDDHPLFEEGVRPAVDLVWLLGLTHDEYLRAFRGTAIRRAKDWMLRRNAAVALGNVGDPGAVSALADRLRYDTNPIVRGHAAWAIGRLGERHGDHGSVAALDLARVTETDDTVLSEIDFASALAQTSGDTRK